MAKCPECNHEIDHLVLVETRNYFIRFTKDGAQYEIASPELVDRIWKCPWCWDQVFNSIDAAREFLKKEVQNGES